MRGREKEISVEVRKGIILGRVCKALFFSFLCAICRLKLPNKPHARRVHRGPLGAERERRGRFWRKKMRN